MSALLSIPSTLWSPEWEDWPSSNGTFWSRVGYHPFSSFLRGLLLPYPRPSLLILSHHSWFSVLTLCGRAHTVCPHIGRTGRAQPEDKT